MARNEHAREVDGKQIRFGIDPVKKEIDIPETVDANDLVNAIAIEFADEIGEGYPLGSCMNGEDGRDLCMAPGWTVRAAHRNRVKNPGEGSDFL